MPAPPIARLLGDVRTVALALVVTAAVVLALPAGPAEAAAPDSVGLVDTASATWTLRDTDGRVARFVYGDPGDVPFMGDWDCDGVDTPGLYRQSDGFVYLRNANTQGNADIEFFFGDPGDVPLAGDFDADGCDTVSLYRPSEARFYIINELGTDGGGLGKAEFSFLFGDTGDTPYVGDFDSDGIDEIGLRRVSAGSVYFRLSLTTGVADFDFFYGDPFDMIFAGDWDGDGDDTVGIFRPSLLRFYLRNTNSQGNADVEIPFGCCGVPVRGNFGPLDAEPEPPPIPDLKLTEVASGFSAPLFLDAPAGDNRLFVVERGGLIKIVSGGVVLPTPFLDISDRTNGQGEQGLLGLAFHPDYAGNGRFFVNHTNPSGNTIIAEYRVSADPNVADPDSRRIVLIVLQPSQNHNGGMIAFGPDGYLWIGSGDGGGSGDPFGNGQDPGTLLGALLRIDVDGALPYEVPVDNPFVGGGGAAEVWAYGLRNPWRFSFDQDQVYIADVGQFQWEEVNVAPVDVAGVNYGWNVMEGAHCFSPSSGCNTAGKRLPALEYGHGDGCSVTGGYVYRGAIPGLAGTYFYSDFCSAFLRSFVYEGGAATDRRTWNIGALSRVSSFGTDGHGELYVVSLTGTVHRIDAA